MLVSLKKKNLTRKVKYLDYKNCLLYPAQVPFLVNSPSQSTLIVPQL